MRLGLEIHGHSTGGWGEVGNRQVKCGSGASGYFRLHIQSQLTIAHSWANWNPHNPMRYWLLFL